MTAILGRSTSRDAPELLKSSISCMSCPRVLAHVELAIPTLAIPSTGAIADSRRLAVVQGAAGACAAGSTLGLGRSEDLSVRKLNRFGAAAAGIVVGGLPKWTGCAAPERGLGGAGAPKKGRAGRDSLGAPGKNAKGLWFGVAIVEEQRGGKSVGS